MCVTAIVASAVATVGGTAASIGASKANAAQQRIALEMERKAIQDEMVANQIRAAEAEVQAVAEATKQRASNLAMSQAMGTRGYSFETLDEANKRKLRLDLANIRTEYLTGKKSAMERIRVNRMTRSAVGIASRYQTIGAVAGGLQQLGDLGRDYAKTQKGD